MTAIERAIGNTERWIEKVQCERDAITREAAVSPLSEAGRSALELRLQMLDAELVSVQHVLRGLLALRHEPALMFEVRPARVLPRLPMVKALLPERRKRPRRKTA